MLITTKELDTALRQASGGAYLFYGEEEYLKRHYLDAFRKKLDTDRDLSAFNHVILQGGDVDALEAECSGLALFGDSRLIEVRDFNFRKMPKETLARICEILSGVGTDTVIVYTLPSEFDPGTQKKPSAALNALAKAASCVEFGRQTPQKLTSWVNKHLVAENCFANAQVCRQIVDYCCADMFVLSNETKKLAAYANAHGVKEITSEIVENVCTSQAVYGAFDFANAILSHDTRKALMIYGLMKKQKQKPVEILSSISRICAELYNVSVLSERGLDDKEIGQKLKMHEYPVKLRRQAIRGKTPEDLYLACEKCLEADKKMKSTKIDSYFLIEELILSL